MEKTEKLVNLTIRVTPEMRKQIAHYTIEQGVTLQEYLMRLITEDMKQSGGATNG